MTHKSKKKKKMQRILEKLDKSDKNVGTFHSVNFSIQHLIVAKAILAKFCEWGSSHSSAETTTI